MKLQSRTRADESVPPPLTTNPFARFVGLHAPAKQVLDEAAPALQAKGFIAIPGREPAGAVTDTAQIDPSLEWVTTNEWEAEPAAGLSYAGLTPGQRGRFLHWLNEPHFGAPAAFLTLYLAYLETSLLEAVGAADHDRASRVTLELRRLAAWPQWSNLQQHARTLLLAYTLTGDGAGMCDWVADGSLPTALLGLALGQQGMLGQPLTQRQVAALARGAVTPPAAVLALRLESLGTSLGAEPLAWALAKVRQGEMLTWRCAHRDLRLASQQPDPLPALGTVIAELLVGETADVPYGVESSVEGDEEDGQAQNEWRLILEFGEARSEYYDFALQIAQKLPGYVVLMDESRHMIHRIHFTQPQMRRFWRLWDYVGPWSSTHVYANGRELQKWQIWPYSQYLR